jgi:nucleoside-diphosphate-sugar epimerase
LRQAVPWYRLARHLRAEGAFHMIHCRDLARVVSLLIDSPLQFHHHEQRLVLGNAAVRLNEFIDQFCLQLGRNSRLKVDLTDRMSSVIIRLFRIQLSAWDRYCLQHRDQSYFRALNPADFGIPRFCPDTASLLDSIGIVKR